MSHQITPPSIDWRFHFGGELTQIVPMYVVADEPQMRTLQVVLGSRMRGASSKVSDGGRDATWVKGNALLFHPTDAPYAVWKLFENDGAGGFYVNFESRTGHADGVDVVDHELDLLVDADGNVTTKDARSFVEMTAAGTFDGELSARVIGAAVETSVVIGAGLLEREPFATAQLRDLPPL